MWRDLPIYSIAGYKQKIDWLSTPNTGNKPTLSTPHMDQRQQQ